MQRLQMPPAAGRGGTRAAAGGSAVGGAPAARWVSDRAAGAAGVTRCGVES